MLFLYNVSVSYWTVGYLPVSILLPIFPAIRSRKQRARSSTARAYNNFFYFFFLNLIFTSPAAAGDRSPGHHKVNGQKLKNMKIFVKTLKNTHFEIEVKPEDSVTTTLLSIYLSTIYICVCMYN